MRVSGHNSSRPGEDFGVNLEVAADVLEIVLDLVSGLLEALLGH